MTKGERQRHRREVLDGAAAELGSHANNGSGWLYNSEGLAELGDEVVAYRLSVLNKLIESIRSKTRTK